MRSISILFTIFLALFSLDVSAQRSGPQPILVDVIGPGGGRSVARSRPAPVRQVRTPRAASHRPAYDVERSAFRLMNAQRASKGLGTLRWNDRIAEVARVHSQNMAANGFFSHRGIDGTMVDDRADLFGVKEWRAIGENIAYLRGYDEPESMAVEKWMQSSAHRRNLLASQWTDSAIGVAVTDDGTFYFTQVFLVK